MGWGCEAKVERVKGSAEDVNGGLVRELVSGDGEKMMLRDEDVIGY